MAHTFKKRGCQYASSVFAQGWVAQTLLDNAFSPFLRRMTASIRLAHV
jgi:hypothetical protein